jgi:3-oxocholest-4-en-26-oyl-CoA dehydrogenase beta subunit
MDFHFTEEQLAVAEAAQGVVDGQSTVERVVAVEETEDRIDRELWAALAAADLLGLPVPESEGGGGLGLTEVCLMLEAQAKRVAPVPLWSTLALGALPLARFGSPEQRKALLPGVASGDTFLSAALTEAAISLAGLPAVTATPSASGWILSGSSMAVPQAHLAERVLVPAKTASDEVVVALIDPRGPGARLERAVTTNREVHPHLHLEDVPVSDGDLLAGPAEGAAALAWMLQVAWTGLCALQLGVTESALQQTAEYLNQREQFGRPLSTFQGTLLRAADAAIDVETIRVTLWQAAWRIDTGREAAGAVGAAKWQASERGQRVVHATQHLHGGIGADITYPIHRYFLWGKQIELMLGGPGVHLAHLGQMIAARGAARGAGEGREGNAG